MFCQKWKTTLPRALIVDACLFFRFTSPRLWPSQPHPRAFLKVCAALFLYKHRPDLCADMLLINLWNKQANVIQVALFIGTHAEGSQGQTNSSPEWFVLKWPSISMALSFITPSLFYVSLHLLSHENTTIVQDGNLVTYRDDMFRRYLKEQYT